MNIISFLDPFKSILESFSLRTKYEHKLSRCRYLKTMVNRVYSKKIKESRQFSVCLFVLSSKKGGLGVSLVVQRLRIHLLMQGTQVPSLVWEDPTCHRAAKPLCHNWAYTHSIYSCQWRAVLLWNNGFVSILRTISEPYNWLCFPLCNGC